MKILQRREHVEIVTYQHIFENLDCPGGFGFSCEEDGSIPEFTVLAEAARRNMAGCFFGEKKVSYQGIHTFRHSYTEPAVGRCECGAEVVFHGFTNTCDECDRDYNMSGQELAPRSQWGEETGESLSDILSIP